MSLINVSNFPGFGGEFGGGYERGYERGFGGGYGKFSIFTENIPLTIQENNFN